MFSHAEKFVLHQSITVVRYILRKRQDECITTYTLEHLLRIPYSLGVGVVGPAKISVNDIMLSMYINIHIVINV